VLSDCSGQDPVNNFALVTYLPAPLGKFLDDLRREMVPGCRPHAHVTILPPRPLSAAPKLAIDAARALLLDFAPFEIEIGQVQVFAATDVVYLSIGRGHRELVHMHEVMNTGPLYYKEPFPYHPHITLAQDLTHEQSLELESLARRRWAEFTYQRAFTAELFAFVQNTGGNAWIDLAHFQLHPAPSIRR
jgi:2'-5' RNA ligase